MKKAIINRPEGEIGRNPRESKTLMKKIVRLEEKAKMNKMKIKNKFLKLGKMIVKIGKETLYPVTSLPTNRKMSVS